MNEFSKAAAAADEPEFNFATVGAVYADGLTLIFDGQTEPTEKHYKCNAFCRFSAGQRVRIIKDSGTYVVEYAVGVPMTSLVVDTATNATKLNNKTESQLDVDTATSAGSATRSNQIINQSNTGVTFDIYLRATSTTAFQIKRGTGAWRNITTTA
jgi:hypothetical protein